MRLIGKTCFTVALISLTFATSGVAGANSRGRGVTLPVMTPLQVKLEETVNIKTAQEGEPFTATLTQPVQVNGVTVIPAGASAAGFLHKGPQSGIELNSLFVNGKPYRVSTSPVAVKGKTSLPQGLTFTFNLTLSVSIAQ